MVWGFQTAYGWNRNQTSLALISQPEKEHSILLCKTQHFFLCFVFEQPNRHLAALLIFTKFFPFHLHFLIHKHIRILLRKIYICKLGRVRLQSSIDTTLLQSLSILDRRHFLSRQKFTDPKSRFGLTNDCITHPLDNVELIILKS